VNPSGKLPITIEKRFQDSPAFRGYLPEGATLYSGWGPDNDMSQPIHNVRYDEGVFVGYRWYETKAIEPMYAFGHGLSYTTFAYKDLKLSSPELADESRLSIEFTLTNTGKVAGAEVAQLYMAPIAPSVVRPTKELKGFAKVTLEPGKGQVVRIRLTRRDFAFWDVKSHGWKAEAGDYRILVGGASNSTPLEAKVTLN
jgi:beta-glucosidase